MNPQLFWRTIRPLRCEQIAYRLLRIAQFRFYRALPRLSKRWLAPPPIAPAIAEETVAIFRRVFESSFVHLNQPLDARFDGLREGRFTFINRTRQIAQPDWNKRYENHLWNYHLHYFDHTLWGARAFAERGDRQAWAVSRRLIESWIEQARMGRSDGWDPYPISMRVVNWIYAYALVAEAIDDRVFLDRWRASLYWQLAFLNRHLEFQHLANHLLKNLKALVIGGLFFNQDQWLRKGERLLWREFDEQVLADGGHFERSPMYHAQALADFLECYALLRALDRMPRNEAIEARLRTMAEFLEAMSYPDGTLALFNDSANTEHARPRPILETAKIVCGYRETRSPREFPQTGYYLWRSSDDLERIIVDAGSPSVEYNSAHAHCDLLSYELWLNGAPFIVDSGVHGYGGDRFREYCRSTRAHNTAVFDGHEQSEVWGTHRMARRAVLLEAEARGDHLHWEFCGAYCPYYDLRVTYKRRIRREDNGNWVVEDLILSEGGAVHVANYIHLHPDVEVRESEENQSVECRLSDMAISIEPLRATGRAIFRGVENLQGWYFPDFGIARPNAVIQFYHIVCPNEPFGYRIKLFTSR